MSERDGRGWKVLGKALPLATGSINIGRESLGKCAHIFGRRAKMGMLKLSVCLYTYLVLIKSCFIKINSEIQYLSLAVMNKQLFSLDFRIEQLRLQY